MAYYLVRAKPKAERLGELQEQLQKDSFVGLRPFGNALTHSLKEARTQPDGIAIWEEEDYCSPPLAEERAAVLDKYFDAISVELVVTRPTLCTKASERVYITALSDKDANGGSQGAVGGRRAAICGAIASGAGGR